VNHLAVVGFGQMGASLAGAWKSGRRILAIDADPAVRRKAAERGFEASDSLDRCALADAALLAVPTREAARILPDVARRLREGAVLLDVATTKAPLVEAYRGAPQVEWVSLHPLAGNERSGIDSADPAMFRGAPFLVVPVRAEEARIAEVEAMVRETGARAIRIGNPKVHDAAVAVTIHLPHVLAYALPHLARETSTDPELAGRSFRDSTRVALSDVRMVLEFLLTGAPRTVEAIDRLTAILGRVREMLARGDEEGLRRFMEEAKGERGRI
jgi:prephenate dehydrogenase